ncbi:MAG: trypsin-like serine protease [Myxococcota bacterium]
MIRTSTLALTLALVGCLELPVNDLPERPSSDTPSLPAPPPPTEDTGTPDPSDVERLGDPRITELADDGHLVVDLFDGRDDPTVIEDARTLILGALDGIVPLRDDADHRIVLSYLGKGDSGEIEPKPHDGPVAIEDHLLNSIAAFNGATGNEFSVSFEGGLLDSIGKYDIENRRDLGSRTEPSEEDHDARSAYPDPQAWSNGADDRTRIYGIDADVTLSAHRRIVQMGGGCTGTLVGPRHVVTAGHCLWSRKDDRWYSGFDVRAGANGSSEVAKVRIDVNDIPAGQALWYYTPSAWRNASRTWGSDYGILVLPARLGDEVGWMGRVTYGAADLQDANIYRRGYPICDFVSDGVERIDDPTPCEDDHLYGNAATCDVGEFEEVDNDGWSRIVHHSCDASAGDSGSPLYVYHRGTPAVAAVHFFSHCGKTEEDEPCEGDLEDRPLAALRLTPEYRDLIGTFRSIFP